jgi:hypothetical protein
MIGEWPRFSTGMWRKLDTIGVEKIASQLAAISRAEGGKSLALLCHEDVTPARGHRCHRVVVSLWWMEQTGREIPELTNEGELLSLHQLHRQTAPILPKERRRERRETGRVALDPRGGRRMVPQCGVALCSNEAR